MASGMREIYVSENGDRWSVGRTGEADRLIILHEANLASGGARTEYGVAEFLSRDPASPQHRELSRVLLTAIEDASDAGST